MTESSENLYLDNTTHIGYLSICIISVVENVTICLTVRSRNSDIPGNNEQHCCYHPGREGLPLG